MKKYFFIIILAICGIISVSADNIRTVEGVSIYYAPEGESLVEAKVKALQKAIENALAQEFGTNVMAIKTSSKEIKDCNIKSEFTSLSSSEVKGEWLETIGEPEFAISYINDRTKIKVTVKGRAREINNEKIDITTRVLRNGIIDSAEDTHFNSGDFLYISFLAPVDGFVTIYFLDKDKTVYRLLPYTYRNEASVKVKAGHRYVFFSPENNTLDGIASHEVMEYNMTCDDDIENNMLYIIFSPNKYSKAIDKNEGYNVPYSLSFNEFQHWLTDRRKNDKMMNVIIKNIFINSNKQN